MSRNNALAARPNRAMNPARPLRTSSSSPQPTSRWALQATAPPSTANHSSRGAARRRSSTLLVTPPPSQVRPDVQRQHDDHPHRVDEVPVHGRGLHMQVPFPVEVAEPGPDLDE